MTYSIKGAWAIVGLLVIVAAGYFWPDDSGSLLGGLIQVSSETGGSSGSIVSTFTRSGTMARQITGSRSGEDSREIWVGGDRRVIVDYRVNVTRGRVRLSVMKVGLGVSVVWSTELETSGSNRVSVPVDASGKYQIIVRTIAFAGNYEVSYGVQ